MTDGGESRVMVVATRDSKIRVFYSANHRQEFYNSAQKVATVANRIGENLSEGVDSNHVKSEFN